MALLPQQKAECLLCRHKGGSTTALLTVYMIFLAGKTGQGQNGALKSRQTSPPVHEHQSHEHSYSWSTLRETQKQAEEKNRNSAGGPPRGIKGQ